MVRPRKPSDPKAWPVPCGRCGGHHQIATRWPDGPICGYCYQQAKRTRGTCPCGHTGVLPGVIDGAPACRACSGVILNIDCTSCGAEDELYRAGRCQRCELALQVDHLLTDPATETMPAQLIPMATALKAMHRPNSGLTWIRQPHVTAFLRHLATTATITHDGLDELPASHTRDYVRALLIEHGALPHRDENLARFRHWADQALDRVTDPGLRDVISRYLRWHHLRRMHHAGQVSPGTLLTSKQTVTVAIELLNWLTREGIELRDLQQGDLDRWVTTGPSTRLLADRFLAWAIRSRLAEPDLVLPRHRRGTSPRLSATDQDQAIHQALRTDELTTRDRAAAILVLVFAQPITAIITLRWEQVTITDEQVTLRLDDLAIALPAPLDEPWRALAIHPGHDQTAAHPESPWVFLGTSPGRHITAATLRQRLGRHFAARAARLGTLTELSLLAPTAILAEALGYHPATIERHARDAAAGYAQYIATLKAAPTTPSAPAVLPD